MIKVSVIIPVYNEELYIGKCLDSICRQSLEDIEIICIDDGSKDNSLQILKKFQDKDSRIKLLYQSNQYAGIARNYGMQFATGKYLIFLDADDYFSENMLEKMYDRAENKNADIVICRFQNYCEKTKQISQPDWKNIDCFFYQKEDFSGKTLKNAAIFQVTNGWAWDKLLRTDYVKESGYKFSTFRSSEDGFFVSMLLTRAKHISYMDNILITHRINNVNSLSNTKEKNWFNGFKMLILIKNELEKEGIYSVYKQSFLNKSIEFLQWYLESMKTFDAFKKCYYYIQLCMENEFGFLENSDKYYFNSKLFEKYKEVISFSLEEYCFKRQKV